MKAIKFLNTNREGYDALQSKIHNYLLSKNGINGFRYSASKYADFDRALSYQNEVALLIDENIKRYPLILECLTQAEIDSIVDVDINWHNSNL